jgi:peptidoglycan hydrolase CwlO-like protein
LQTPFYLTIQNDTVIAIADMETGGWKTARETFEVFQSVLNNVTDIQNDVDIAKVQKTVEDMQRINGLIEKLRKHNNSAIQGCEKVREDITKLERTIIQYQQKLRGLLSPQND